eukprot:262755_1
MDDVTEEIFQQLEDLRGELCRPDAVIDPSIITTLRDFATISAQFSGGAGQEMLKKYLVQGQKLLISNYCGYTKLCNLLLDWMKNIQDPKTINDTFIRILKKSAIELYEEVNRHDDDRDEDNNYQKKIISDIDEITKSYGDTTVKYHGFSLFEFQDKFKNHLNKILVNTGSGGNNEYERKVQRLVIYCCKNELYYLYSRRLLSELRESNLWTKLDYALSNIESKLDEFVNSNNNKINTINNNNKIGELTIYGKGIVNSPILLLLFIVFILLLFELTNSSNLLSIFDKA